MSSVDEFFRTDKRLKPYFDQVAEELIRDGCYSINTMYITTIERLLDKIDDLEEGC